MQMQESKTYTQNGSTVCYTVNNAIFFHNFWPIYHQLFTACINMVPWWKALSDCNIQVDFVLRLRYVFTRNQLRKKSCRKSSNQSYWAMILAEQTSWEHLYVHVTLLPVTVSQPTTVSDLHMLELLDNSQFKNLFLNNINCTGCTNKKQSLRKNSLSS